MIFQRVSTKKRVAAFFLLLWSVETFAPLKTFALTSGPKQPEHISFTPAGANDMVDLFTGGFKYNIPLLDIDGYPINLSYHSGSGIDDEASWVGLGWSINIGAINRELRGLPDDFNGDQMTTEFSIKPKITFGAKGTVRGELAGKHFAQVQGSLSVGLFSDNYNGTGAEFGLNAGLGIGPKNTGILTGNINIGLNSNTSSGVTTSVGAGISYRFFKNDNILSSMGLSASLGYNSREGMKDLTLGASYGSGKPTEMVSGGMSLNKPVTNPKINFGYKTTSRSLTGEVGGTGWILFGGGGFTGYYNKQEILNKTTTAYGYGALYAHNGTNKREALMDFIREKENPIVPTIPNLAVPILTPDNFSYTSQAGSGQFKLNRGNAAVIFDNFAQDKSSNMSAGADYGIGAYFHGGVALYNQDAINKTAKWTVDNNYLNIGDYKLDANRIDEEQVYFKEHGELQAESAEFANLVGGDKVVNVPLNGNGTSNSLKDKNNQTVSGASLLKKNGRQARSTSISYQTAREANNYKDNGIKVYPLLNTSSSLTACPQASYNLPRVGGVRNKDHISSMTVTQPDGKRLEYGLPVYSVSQDEYSFALGSNVIPDDRNLVPVPMSNGKINESTEGDAYYQHHQVAPYATSFLLTGLYSTDYVDVNNDGITPDDLGTAIKFNYSRGNDYQWRTPTQPGMAQFNPVLQADRLDNKGSVVTGVRELWYVQSIETKTKVVYFITDDRQDGFGVSDLAGNINSQKPQKRLAEIRIYSKSDMTTPIKTVVLQHTYDLCKGLPNATSNGGKLTLSSLYFTYGSSTKDANHKYEFKYEKNASYNYRSSDRWGNYKSWKENEDQGITSLRNDEYPYVTQKYDIAKDNASQWNLSSISLPTGGQIKVDYESGDYAYVQDRKAMQMVNIKDMVSADGTVVNNLARAKGFRLSTPGPLRGNTDAEVLRYFIQDYLNGRNDFYARLKVNISDVPLNNSDGYFDIVPAYGELSRVKNNNNGTIDVYFKDVADGGTNVNPFLSAAWQRMRLDYPMYAYPGYKNRIDKEMGIEQALNALVQAVKNIAELKVSFNERALKKSFGTLVKLDKSFARLVKADGHKFGGSARVKWVSISDGWNAIAGGRNTTSTYGQYYDYTIEENGKSISSGVAAYEPGIGGDENPMRMPVPYSQMSRGALTNFFYLEEPFGESLFPGPQIGYRKVTVRALNGDNVGSPDPENATGWTTSEFYTAKDFPVKVEAMAKPDVKQNGPYSWGNFAGGVETYELIMSQGYAITINDMHGKPKADRVYNQTGVEISSTSYSYKADDIDGGKMKLNNVVSTIDEQGVVRNAEMIGREIELVTDMREQEYKDLGQSIHVGGDVFPLGPWVFAWGHHPKRNNDSYRLFRSAVTLKTITQTGILDHVTKTINGSTATTNNLVFDRTTGMPVVTSTTNAFNDPVYSVTLPAYWKYKGMSGAYKTINTVFNDFSSDVNGVIAAKFSPYLAAGDELESKDNVRLWVIGTVTDTDNTLKMRLVDDRGDVVKSYAGAVKVIRSGNRNQQGAATASVVCLKNPVVGNTLGVFVNGDAAAYKVLSASTALFEEAWNGTPCVNCASGVLSPDGKYCVTPATLSSVDYKLVKGSMPSKSGNLSYGFEGAYFYNNSTTNYHFSQSSAEIYKRKLYDNGVWPLNTNNNQWYGIETCLEVPRTGVYSIGYAVDNAVLINIDNTQLFTLDKNTSNTFNDPYVTFGRWFVRPVTLTAGTHKLLLQIQNYEDEASVHVEFYDATVDQLAANATLSETQRIFNLNDVLYGKNYNVFYYGGSIGSNYTKYRNCSGSYDVCASVTGCTVPSPQHFNPYVMGMLGNWRASEEKVLTGNRTDNQISATGSAGVNVRNSGNLKSYMPYWYLNNGAWTTNPANSQWITSRYVTGYNRNGAEDENKNALMQYSGVLFGFNGTLATAIAQNARKQDVYYEGFEDYKLQNSCAYAAPCIPDRFSMTSAIGTVVANPEMSHTGNYSLKLTKPIYLTTSVSNTNYSPGYGVFLDNDASGRYVRKKIDGLYETGFHPGNKKYIFSAWVKNGSETTATASDPDVTIQVDRVALKYKVMAVVEGWKKIEGTFTVSGQKQFDLSILENSNYYIDDIRIFPYDALMQSHVYDDKSLRLMATLDENNFATLYEYDDAGILIRTKKETERGIMTIKETRTVIRKN